MTCMDWMNVNTIVFALNNGQVFQLDILTNIVNIIYNYKYNAIWDIYSIDHSNLLLAADSGHIFHLFQNNNIWLSQIIAN